MTNDEHETCDVESCEICIERERRAARDIKAAVGRVVNRISLLVERRRRRPQA